MAAEGPAADDGTVRRTATQLLYAVNNGNASPNWGRDTGTLYLKRGENVQMAIINDMRKITVSGDVYTSDLQADVKMYEVVFVLMLKSDASTWDVPMNFGVTLPDGSQMKPGTQNRTENLVSKPKQQFLEILAGEFETIPNMNAGTIKFSLDIESPEVPKHGLVIKSVIFRPVSTPLIPLIPLIPKAIPADQEINVRELSIYRGHLKDHWSWDVIQQDPNGNIFFEVVRLLDIGWLEVRGKYDARALKIGTTYVVVFLLRLTDDADGWENNGNVTLQVDDQVRLRAIDTYKSNEFRELIVGDITAGQATITRGIEFSLSETTTGRPKKGFVIQKVLLRQKYLSR